MNSFNKNMLQLSKIIQNRVKMVVDDKLLDKLAKLSSIKISKEQKESLKGEFSDILTFIDNLNSIDVSGVEASYTTLKGGTPLREDIVQKDEEFVSTLFRNAPKSENGYFVVPKILE